MGGITSRRTFTLSELPAAYTTGMKITSQSVSCARYRTCRFYVDFTGTSGTPNVIYNVWTSLNGTNWAVAATGTHTITNDLKWSFAVNDVGVQVRLELRYSTGNFTVLSAYAEMIS